MRLADPASTPDRFAFAIRKPAMAFVATLLCAGWLLATAPVHGAEPPPLAIRMTSVDAQDATQGDDVRAAKATGQRYSAGAGTATGVPGCPCIGDVDGDGTVAQGDVDIVNACAGQLACSDDPTAPCTSDVDCTAGNCSASLSTLCHSDADCPLGETCVGAATCELTSDCSGCVNDCDVNCDGVVDSQDVTLVTDCLGSSGTANCCDTCVDGAACTADVDCGANGSCDSFGTCVCNRKCAPPGLDCWSTPCGSTRYDFSFTPIPAGFFGSGCDGYSGVVLLGGNTGFADTEIERLDEMCFDDPLPTTSVSNIQLTQLDLTSCRPITVICNGTPEYWDVHVFDDGTQPLGTLTATKTSPTGGTFDTSLPIVAGFEFIQGTTTLPFNPGVQQTLTSTGLEWKQDAGPNVCNGGEFGAGVNPDQSCCNESCHSSFGTAPHEHCVRPPECPPCPVRCCLPDGSCINVDALNCRAQDGAPGPAGSACAGTDDDGNLVDDACELDQPCGDCGPGSHWVDNCPAGQDLIPTGAVVGIDTDFDCIEDETVVLNGPAAIDREAGTPHSIETEIVQMNLSGSGVTLRAGQGGGSGGVLPPSFGRMDELASNPFVVDSFFDVMFEIQLSSGDLAYNHEPLRVESQVDCVPPIAIYSHPSGCISLYDSPIPGTGTEIARLVTADHSTFPQQKCAPPDIDCWSTPCGTTRYDFSTTPIPAGFFGPGSDPFVGEVFLGGNTGFVDTSIARLDQMCFDGPVPVTAQTDIQLTQLDLTSCRPIKVTFNGGLNPEYWDVRVFPDGTQPIGTMTVTKSNSIGGTYDTSLPVRAGFEFSRGATTSPPFLPGTVQTLTSTGLPWTQNIAPNVCNNGEFGPGAVPGQDCCRESCHSSGGTAPHEHCVQPPECPICPEKCCLPSGTCVDVDPASCRAQNGAPGGPGSQCAGADSDGNGVDDACESDGPCSDCGPGSHWIDNCPAGQDTMPTGAVIGIDTSGDCVEDQTVVLRGPTVIDRGEGTPHTVETEIVSMNLTGSGVSLTAGAGGGSGGVLPPSLGRMDEQPADPFIVDSFFDVMFEINLGGGQLAYNHDPLRVEAEVTCVPPIAIYRHPTGCIPLFDSPTPGTGTEIARLVTADHSTFPDDKCVPPGDDCWTTACDGTTQVEFGSSDVPPIPADFFYTGSDPFTGVVDLGGASMFIDTVVRRLDQMCFPDPLPTTEQIPIQLTQLNLTSCQPITVTGTQAPQQWNVFVGLDGIQPQGDLTATKDNANGGTFTANLPVQALFNFERVSDSAPAGPFAPGTTTTLQTVSPTSWLQIPVGSPCGEDGFNPGWNEDPDTGDPCCEPSCHAGPSPGHEHCTVPPECPLCPEPPVCDKPAPAGQDCWSTPCGRTQMDFSDNPIPAGFFGPGSEPFEGVVRLQGATGGVDTVVERLSDMCFDGTLPITQTVSIQLTQLDLVSCEPIIVSFNGGASTQQFDVRVFLDGTQPQGTLDVTKDNANGGTFDTSLPVVAGFEFTGAAGTLPPFTPGVQQTLTSTGLPWQQTAPPGVQTCGDGFHPGVQEDENGDPCCQESCHSAGGTAQHDHCVVPPGCPVCPECFYDNGPPLDDVGAPASQYDDLPAETFSGEAADDFVLKGVGDNPCLITNGRFWATHFNVPAGITSDPATQWRGVTVTIYDNASPKGPSGHRLDDGSFTGTVVATQTVGMADVTVTPVSLACLGTVFQIDVPIDIALDKNHKYWIVFQPLMDRTDDPAGAPGFGQTAVLLSQTNTDHPAQQIFPIAGLPNWTEVDGNFGTNGPCNTLAPGSLKDIAFQLTAEKLPPCKPATAGDDCWSTACGDTVFDFSDTPIPAGFFGPGSDPFTGQVPLQGATGGIDTIVTRLHDMCFDSPLPSSSTTDIQLTQLDLVGCQPITVTFNGGNNPQAWNVQVGLNGVQPLGSMTATKTHANGGTFDSELPVDVLFTFTRTGETDRDFAPGPQTLDALGVPWLQDAPGVSPCGTGGFVPGVQETGAGTCCPESCHSSRGAAPHEHCVTPPDCAACPEIQPPLPAGAPHNRSKNRYISFDPNPANAGAGLMAFEVRYDDGSPGGVHVGWVAPPGGGWTGASSCPNCAWVVDLANRGELSGSDWLAAAATGLGNSIHVGDCEIGPDRLYSVRAVDIGSGAATAALPIPTTPAPDPGVIFWADAVGGFGWFCSDTYGCCDPNPDCPGATCPAGESCIQQWPLPDGATNFGDVSAAIRTFQQLGNYPEVEWVDMHGAENLDPSDATRDAPNHIANFADVQLIIKAFQGDMYFGQADPTPGGGCPNPPLP